MSNRSILPKIFDQGSHLFKEFNRALRDLEGSFGSVWKETPFMSGTRREMIQPDIDIIENDKEIQIIADLPGLTEKDINIELKKDSFSLTGEKKHEREEDEGNYHILER